MLSKAIRKVEQESDLDKKILAAEELRLQAKELVKCANRLLEYICLILATLNFCLVVYFELDLERWLYPILGLLVLPVILNIVLAVMYKNKLNLKIAVKRNFGTGKTTVEKLRSLEDTLLFAQIRDLDLKYHYGTSGKSIDFYLYLIFIAPPLILAVITYWDGLSIQSILLIIALPIASYLLFYVYSYYFYLKKLIVHTVTRFAFATSKSEKQIRQLRDRVIKEAEKMYPEYAADRMERQREEDRQRRKREEEERNKFLNSMVREYTREHFYEDGSKKLSDAEKNDYIREHFSYIYSTYNLERIDADDSLSPSQKEDLKRHLRIYGD